MGADHPEHARSRDHRGTLTLAAGLAIIAAAAAGVALDVAWRGGVVLPADHVTVAPPRGPLGHAARWVAVHMTPLCWCGFLLAADGLLCRSGGSPAGLRPGRFWTCWVTSVGVWLGFDWVNFRFIHAWQYHGLEPLGRLHAWTAMILAFAAISPAMFLCAEWYQRLGLARLRGPRLALGPWAQLGLFAAGVAAMLYPLAARNPSGALTLWVALVGVLDPLNVWIGRGRVPTLIGDWAAGRWGRTVALMAAGLTCGVLWEAWNYWAAAKWTYDLPFLGPLQRYRLFEMPLPGFAGFLPFALECWVAFNSIVLVLRAAGARFIEPLPDERAVL